LRDIPIIMMSAAPESALRRHLQEYEAFLRKPFRLPVLLELIESLLSPRRSSSPR